MDITLVIPARYGSQRLPAKPLMDLNGHPMIWHTVQRAKEAGAAQIIVTSDDQRVLDVLADETGISLCLTSAEHHSGTERLAEVCQQYQFPPDRIIVNVQGDEPLLPPALIQHVAQELMASRLPMATLAVPLLPEDIFNPHAVKVVLNANRHALYFSRAAIPWDRDRFPTHPPTLAGHHWRHVGLYAYRAEFITHYTQLSPSPLEQLESLEQLRVLWHGYGIQVGLVNEAPPAGIDTPEDLARVRLWLEQHSPRPR